MEMIDLGHTETFRNTTFELMYNCSAAQMAFKNHVFPRDVFVAMRSNVTLIDVDFSLCELSEEAVRCLCSHLLCNTALRRLRLPAISGDAKFAVHDLMAINEQLVVEIC